MSHDDDDGLHALRFCHDCNTEAPRTTSEFTLISSRYGWRLAREVTTGGRVRLIWRCPACWDKYKKSLRPPA